MVIIFESGLVKLDIVKFGDPEQWVVAPDPHFDFLFNFFVVVDTFDLHLGRNLLA